MLKKFLLAAVVIATVASVSMAGCLSNSYPQSVANNTNGTTNHAAVPVQQATTDARNPDGSVATPVATNGDGNIKYPIGTTNHDTGLPITKQPTTGYIRTPAMVASGDGIPIVWSIVTGVGTKVPYATVTFIIRGQSLGTATADANGDGTSLISTAGMPLGSFGAYMDFAGNSQYDFCRTGWGSTIVAGTPQIQPTPIAPIATPTDSP